MDRRRRTAILIDGDRSLAEELANEIETSEAIDVLEQPSHGLALVKARETAKGSLYYMGEVLVTECKVRIGPHPGLGIVKGDRPELAWQLAVIDAACRANLEQTAAWDERLEREEARIRERRRELSRALLRTKVSFDTMKTDDV